MNERQKTFVLIDGMALMYRGHFALIKNPRLTFSGLNTSSVYVFANSLFDLIKRLEPSHIAVAFDTAEPTHRHKFYKPYKAQREAMPEDLAKAIPYVYRLCEAMNIQSLTCPGWEADDIVGTLTRRAEDDSFLTYMVTPDKDFAQLVSENTLMYKPAQKGGGFDELGVPEILKKWDIERVNQVIDILGLMGDASDNIPGIPGVGLKTAQKLIKEFGSIEQVLKNGDSLKGKLKEKIVNNHDIAILSKKLVTIDRNTPITVEISELAFRKYNETALKSLFIELEFKNLGKRIFGDEFQSTLETALDKESDSNGTSTAQDTIHTYKLVETETDRDELFRKLMIQSSVCFDLETTGLDPKTCEPLGIAFSWKPRQAFYLPIPADLEEKKKILLKFLPFFESRAIEKIGHNLKFDISVLRWQGIEVRGPLFDTMIAAFLTMPHIRRNMDSLAENLLHYSPISITSLIGEKKKGKQLNMRDIPLPTIAEYAGEDADITFQLYTFFRPIIEKQNQTQVFYTIECPLIPVIVAMEWEGISLNLPIMDELSIQLEHSIEKTQSIVFELAGEEFLLNSPKQLGDILFDTLKLDPRAKKTPKLKQYATNEQVLSRLAAKHEIAQKVLEYRTFTKLKSTYVDSLPGTIFHKTKRIHTTFEQTVSASGRLQSNNPNLQNIPIRSALGKEIRKAFVARDQNHLLLSADYSQIELRIAAEMSGDQLLLKAFQDNLDIHTATAMRIFGLEKEHITKEMRSKAKMVNFGILYGISPFGLSERMNLSLGESKFLIETYFNNYPGVRQFLDETIAFAHKNEYVCTLTGRRRYLRDINSKNLTVQKSAERVAINAPIQGTAADLIKVAMNNIYTDFKNKDFRSKMILQVHDELLFDVHYSEEKQVTEIVRDCMTTAIPMKVPLIVEIGVAENWLDAH